MPERSPLAPSVAPSAAPSAESSAQGVLDEERLIEAQKLESVGLIAGGIAHDFNNLLTVIVGRASLALLKLGADHPARVDIDELIAAGRTAAHLTRQLLAYAGRGRFEVRLLDVAERVDALLDLLSASLPKGAQISRRLPRALPSIEADIGQFQQVVMNLVINAAEALPQSIGKIDVTAGITELSAPRVDPAAPTESLAAGRYVYVEVADSGPGFDEATRARILQPFFSTKGVGRGLGLAAVHGILRAHHGGLMVESSPGKGTRFRALFPAAKEQADAPSRSTFSVHANMGGVALVVDDEPAIRELARLTLEHIGFTVVQAASVAEGIACFEARKQEFAIVLLDLTMPDGSGVTVWRRIRELGSDVPIVVSSGYDAHEAADRLAGDPRAAFLPKPYTPAQCAACLVTLMDRIRTAQSR